MLEGSNNKISFQKQLGSLVFKNKNCNWSFSIFVKFPCPRFDQLDNGSLSVMAAREVGVGVDGTLRCLNFTVNQGQAYPARSHCLKAESVGSCRFQIRLCWSSCWHCVAVVYYDNNNNQASFTAQNLWMTISEPFCKTNMSPKLYVRRFKQQK